MVGVGRAAIGGEELAAAGDLVADRGHDMLPAAAAEKAQGVAAMPVARQDAFEVPAQAVLSRQRRRQVERPAQPEMRRDGVVHRVGPVEPDRLQHPPACRRRGVGNVGVDESIVRWHGACSLDG